MLRSGLKIARSLAMEKSQAMPISWPPPTRMPLTRQTTGLSQCRIAVTMSLNRRMYWRYSAGAPAYVSAYSRVLPPAQKARSPAPVKITATAARSLLALRKARITSLTVSVV